MVFQRAHAKVNLTLTVRGRRADGYHELESLVTFASVHDAVTLDPEAPQALAVTGPFAHGIVGENLLARAVALLRQAEPGLRIGSVALEKNLPVAAGLGGGSADAAALLRAVRVANPRHAAGVPWHDVAAKLGADVPVCLASEPAVMAGVGERVVAVQHMPELEAVIVNPRVPLSTADVFKALNAVPAGTAAERPVPLAFERPQQLLDFMRARGNDLEPPATRLLPVIAGVKAALAAEPGCELAAMSGSGPTCFGIFAEAARAREAAARIAGAHGGWWVQAATLQGTAAV